jgi:hypothetical protein
MNHTFPLTCDITQLLELLIENGSSEILYSAAALQISRLGAGTHMGVCLRFCIRRASE